VSKKTNALKQAARRKPKHRKRKKRPNPAYGRLPGGQQHMFPPLFDFAFDMLLLEALRRSGIRDALIKALSEAAKQRNPPVILTSEETVQ